MSAGSEEDGVAMYMPGYVDAVTNFGIALIFVITVLILIVLQGVLQIGNKTIQKMNNPEAKSLAAASAVMEPHPPEVGASLDTKEKNKSETAVPKDRPSTNSQLKQMKELQEQLAQSQKELEAAKATTVTEVSKDRASSSSQQKQIKELQEQLAQAQKELEAAKATTVAPTVALATTEQPRKERTETVTASQKAANDESKKSSVQSAESGLRVVFNPDAVGLMADEEKILLEKLAGFGSVATDRWRLMVYTPKGFSEASRLAFYRITAVRNSLIKAGVQPSQIDLRVIETKESGANNAIVFVESKR